MKTKELIRRLQEEDPSGELEVCVENVDIHFVELQPAYYDGPLQVLIRDPNCKTYNIIGAKYKREGSKVKIHTLAIADVLIDRPEIPIDYSELDKERAKTTKENHDKLRQFCANVEYKIAFEDFTDWVKTKTDKITVDTEGLSTTAKYFFDKYIYGIKIPIPLGMSNHEAHIAYWNDHFEIISNEGFIEICLKK